jgi:hypothetical protein
MKKGKMKVRMMRRRRRRWMMIRWRICMGRRIRRRMMAKNLGRLPRETW